MSPKLPKPQHRLGYTCAEIYKILKKNKIEKDKFWNMYGINTCGFDEKTKEIYYYPIDVERTLASILGYREVSFEEWD